MSIHEKRSGWETLGIGSYEQDTFYYMSIQIGTPPQTIDVSIDTGLGDLWVQSSTCQGCQSNLTTDGSKASFDSQASTSFVGSSELQPVEINYPSGANISGIYGIDKVSVAQYTFSDQSFILALNKTGDFAAAGTMGFGWNSIAILGSPWWLNVIDQFEAPEFSLFLSEWVTSQNTVEEGGQLTLGGRNQSLYEGDITFVPLTQRSQWLIPLKSVIVNGNTLSLSANSSAAIDSGTKLIYGPDDVVANFFAGVPGAQQGEAVDSRLQGYWAVPCSTVINPQFKFSDSATLTVPSTNFLWAQVSTNTTYCIAALLGSSNFGQPTPTSAAISSATTLAPRSTQSTPPWVLGTAYLKSVYTVFQSMGSNSTWPSVGFAPIQGVNYSTNRTQTIGVGGDGANGRLGQAGVTVAGTSTQTGTTHSGAGRAMGTLRSHPVWVTLLMAGYAIGW